MQTKVLHAFRVHKCIQNSRNMFVIAFIEDVHIHRDFFLGNVSNLLNNIIILVIFLIAYDLSRRRYFLELMTEAHILIAICNEHPGLVQVKHRDLLFLIYAGAQDISFHFSFHAVANRIHDRLEMKTRDRICQ